MSGYSWTLPGPTSGAGATGKLVQTAIEKLYGKDLWFDVAGAQGVNLVVDTTGDWMLASGEEVVRQSLIRRICTVQGSWKTKPGYGASALHTVKRLNTKSERDRLAERITTQCLIDERVVKVESVAVEAIGSELRIAVRVKLKGQAKRSLPVVFSLKN